MVPLLQKILKFGIMKNGMLSNRRNPAFAIFLCALLWSTGGILIKLTNWDALSIAGTRSLIGAITMMVVLRRFPRFFVKSEDGSINKKETVDRILGMIMYAATMIFYVFANKLTTSANAILMQYTNIIYIIAFGPLLLGEKNTTIDFCSSIGIFAGMILLVSDGFSQSNGSSSLLGCIFGLVSGIAFGFTTIFMRRQKDGNPEDSFILSHLLTFIVAIPAIISSGTPDLQSIGGLFALGIFQIGLPSILYSVGITRVNALSAALITMLEPLMNPIWVFLFYGEKPSITTIFGGIIILTCMFIRSYIKAKKGKSK